jgi:type IX secretion system PorP/SprF family membrane protein
MNSKHTYCFLFLLVVFTTCNAQENIFLLSNRVLGANNPSFFGFNNDSEVSLLHSVKSVNDISIQSSFLSVVKHFPNNNFSVSLSFFRENMGVPAFTNTKANLSFIYKVNINDSWKAYPSVSAGGVNNTIDYSSLIFGDQLNLYSNNLGITSESFEDNQMVRFYQDYSAGIMINNSKLFLGFALLHLNRPKLFIDQSLKKNVGFSAQLGYEININSSYLFLYSSMSKLANQTNFMINQDYTIGSFSIGAFQVFNKIDNVKLAKNIGASIRLALGKIELTASHSIGMDKNLNTNSSGLGIIFNFNPDKLESEGYNKRFYLD